MSNTDIEVAHNYHEQTKHSYRSVRSDTHSLDFSNRPVPFKSYPGLKPIPLPKPMGGHRDHCPFGCLRSYLSHKGGTNSEFK